MAAAGADLLGAKAPKHPIFQPPYHLNPTMSAALKDDIKSAMSGVGVTLSGDMLSKCEFCVVLLRTRALSISDFGRTIT